MHLGTWRTDLLDILDAGAHVASPVAAPDGRDHGRARESSERPDVRVVGVQVRQQHGVDRPQRRRLHRLAGDADERTDAPPEHRVGEQSHPVELDQHGRVSEPGDLEPLPLILRTE